jgi:DNA-binding HxlR family transcriptional regulator
MTHSSAECRSHCPVNFVLETFGDRWTLLIVRDLMFKGKRSYGAFLESDEKIATNILADRLKRLEEHGIVNKMADPEKKSRYVYALTAKGKDLLPVMLEITAWSAKHDKLTNTPPGFLKAYRKDRAALLAALRA